MDEQCKTEQGAAVNISPAEQQLTLNKNKEGTEKT